VSSFVKAAVVAPNNDTDLPRVTNALYIGQAGTLKVTLKGDTDVNAVTFTAVPAGTVLNIKAKKVFATGTSAALILALY